MQYDRPKCDLLLPEVDTQRLRLIPVDGPCQVLAHHGEVRLVITHEPTRPPRELPHVKVGRAEVTGTARTVSTCSSANMLIRPRFSTGARSS